jgi:hypothetical protein
MAAPEVEAEAREAGRDAVTERKLLKRSGRAMFEQRAGLAASGDDLKLIAAQVPAGWPAPSEADVYVASALVCNDMVDHYSTRFTEAALEQIVALLPGTNVLRNHSEYGSSDLPIGRCFAAEIVRQADGIYVRARFYWERGTEFGDDMAKRIALGIWREVSLSWWMSSFTNSIDGQPFDESPYYPGQELPDGQTVVGIMDDVVEVNEFSIVARGGQKNTSMNPARSDGDVLELVQAARSRATEKRSGFEKFFKQAS